LISDRTGTATPFAMLESARALHHVHRSWHRFYKVWSLVKMLVQTTWTSNIAKEKTLKPTIRTQSSDEHRASLHLALLSFRTSMEARSRQTNVVE